ncbi:unnamed protein product [Durusdinium trenchii]|uniref:Uncharacterized protein n=1 Tax=Durusdinium trenchii TaxID=1381693 RepID=A0ABP0LDG4_9DINO
MPPVVSRTEFRALDPNDENLTDRRSEVESRSGQDRERHANAVLAEVDELKEERQEEQVTEEQFMPGQMIHRILGKGEEGQTGAGLDEADDIDVIAEAIQEKSDEEMAEEAAEERISGNEEELNERIQIQKAFAFDGGGWGKAQPQTADEEAAEAAAEAAPEAAPVEEEELMRMSVKELKQFLRLRAVRIPASLAEKSELRGGAEENGGG